jgi:small subunit ribosomal protein S20
VGSSAGFGLRGRRTLFGTIVDARLRAFFTLMPNIKQQKKRVDRASRERLENLRYRSTVKTLTRRLQAAVESADADAIASEHRELVRWIDKAASHGALHKNTAARKKAQAARLATQASSTE